MHNLRPTTLEQKDRGDAASNLPRFATCPLEKLASRWPVVVVGAGPAGLSVALSLARAGQRVLVIEAQRFPRHKVCGGCLNRRAQMLLQQLGVTSARLADCTHPLHQFQLWAGRQHVQLSLPEGRAVERAELDARLAEEAIAAGVTFVDDTRAKWLGASADGHRLALQPRQGTSQTPRQQPPAPLKVEAELLISACGLGNRLLAEQVTVTTHAASRIGLEALVAATETPLPRTEEDSFRQESIGMVVGRQGYVGLAQLTGGRLHVAAALDRQLLQQAPQGADAVQAILNSAGLAMPDSWHAAKWRGTRPLTTRSHQVAGPRWFAIGDAAGYVEPFTGEGIRWALESGVALAPLIEEALQTEWEPQLATRWQHLYDRRVRREQRICRAVTWALRRPTLTTTACAALRVAPWLARPFINVMNQE